MHNEIKLLLLLNKCAYSINRAKESSCVNTHNTEIIERYINIIKDDLYLYSNSKTKHSRVFSAKAVKNVVDFIKHNDVKLDPLIKDVIESMLLAHGNVNCIADYADYKDNINLTETYYSQETLDNYTLELVNNGFVNEGYSSIFKTNCINILHNAEQLNATEKYNIFADLKIKLALLNRSDSYTNVLTLANNNIHIQSSLSKLDLFNPSRLFIDIKRNLSTDQQALFYLYGKHPLMCLHPIKLSNDHVKLLMGNYDISENFFVKTICNIDTNSSLGEIICNIFIGKNKVPHLDKEVSSIKHCTFNYIKEYINATPIDKSNINAVFLLETIKHNLINDKLMILDRSQENFYTELLFENNEKKIIHFFDQFTHHKNIENATLLIDAGWLTTKVLSDINKVARFDNSCLKKYSDTIKNIINFTQTSEEEIIKYVQKLNKTNSINCFEIKKLIHFEKFSPYDITNIIEAGKRLVETYQNMEIILGVMKYFVQNKVTYNQVATSREDVFKNRVKELIEDFERIVTDYKSIEFKIKSNIISFKEYEMDASELFKNNDFRTLYSQCLREKIEYYNMDIFKHCHEKNIQNDTELSGIIKEGLENKSSNELMKVTFFGVNPFNYTELDMTNNKNYENIIRSHEKFNFKRNRSIIDKMNATIEQETSFEINDDYL